MTGDATSTRARPAERDQVAGSWERFIADGEAHGPYVLARPDGSEVAVRFAAKANAPWPGSHASLLVEQEKDEGALDVDQALVQAGFVARYAG